jgi:hypothetical protein
MVKSMYDGLIGFSAAIPRAVTLLGAFFSVIGFVAALFFLINALFFSPMPGWSTIMVTLSLFFGIAFVILGTICEYLLRIYVESTRRPLYFIASDTNDAELGCHDRREDEARHSIHA